jgi:integrase
MASKHKRNKENKGLPSRWRYKHGAYYFRVPEGLRSFWGDKSEFRLGKTLDEAYRTWAEKLEFQNNAKTMSELFDRYALEVIPTKSNKSQQANNLSLRKLRPVFGHMLITNVKPQHVYQYRDLRGREGKKAANMDLEVLSHCFTKAIEWGLLESHPTLKNVKKFEIEPNDRYVEDWELEESLKVASPFIKAYINIKLLTALRQGDILSLKMSDLKEDGIYVTPNKTARKTKKSLLIEWTPALREAVDEAIKLRRKEDSKWLFHTNVGEPYIKPNHNTSGFKSAWKRFMKKALKETELKESFSEQSLRAKAATDIDDLHHANKLLGHSTLEITKRVYRRKAERVKPTR